MRQFLGLCCCLVTGLVAAEVVDVSPQGFVSKHELVLVASPEAGYRALVEEVDQWWDASHSFAGDASAFRIDDGRRPMDCRWQLYQRIKTSILAQIGYGHLVGLAAHTVTKTLLGS